MILSKIVSILCTDDGFSAHNLSHLIEDKLLFLMSIMSILLQEISSDLLARDTLKKFIKIFYRVDMLTASAKIFPVFLFYIS